MSSSNRSEVSEVGNYSSHFDPADSLSKFHITESDSDDQTDQQTDAFTVNQDDEASISKVHITPYKGFEEIFGTRITGQLLTANYLKPELAPEKTSRIEEWLINSPDEEDSNKQEQEKEAMPPPPSPNEPCNKKSRTHYLKPRKAFDTIQSVDNSDRKFDCDMGPVLVPAPSLDTDILPEQGKRYTGVKRSFSIDENMRKEKGMKFFQLEGSLRSSIIYRKPDSSQASSGNWHSKVNKPVESQVVKPIITGEDDKCTKSEEAIKGTPVNGSWQHSKVKEETPADKGRRRPIVIDGCNVAYAYSQEKCLDSKGIQVCIDYFLQRGFTDVLVVIPEHKLATDNWKNAELLEDLKHQKTLHVCPTGKLSDDGCDGSPDEDGRFHRMIAKIAQMRNAVIISNYNFENTLIVQRVLGFRFMPGKPDHIMFPSDPFGRYGPNLDEFLRY